MTVSVVGTLSISTADEIAGIGLAGDDAGPGMAQGGSFR